MSSKGVWNALHNSNRIKPQLQTQYFCFFANVQCIFLHFPLSDLIPQVSQSDFHLQQRASSDKPGFGKICSCFQGSGRRNFFKAMQLFAVSTPCFVSCQSMTRSPLQTTSNDGRFSHALHHHIILQVVLHWNVVSFISTCFTIILILHLTQILALSSSPGYFHLIPNLV